jgi:hypothetical protein
MHASFVFGSNMIFGINIGSVEIADFTAAIFAQVVANGIAD